MAWVKLHGAFVLGLLALLTATIDQGVLHHNWQAVVLTAFATFGQSPPDWLRAMMGASKNGPPNDSNGGANHTGGGS